MGVITPNRPLTAVYDVPDPDLLEDGWTNIRYGADIDPSWIAKYTNVWTEDQRQVMQLKSGGWTIKPYQKDLSWFTETTVGELLQISLSDLNYVTTSTLPHLENYPVAGRTARGDISGQGPIFVHIRKVVPDASGNWSASITSGLTGPAARGSSIVHLDRIWESKQSWPTNQGFNLHWIMPGGRGSDYTALVWQFYFGQFCLSLNGSGLLDLFERADDLGVNWNLRDSWVYCTQANLWGRAHNLLIIPHQTGNISFIGDVSDSMQFFDRNPDGGYTYANIAAQEHVYKSYNPSATSATINEHIRFDQRRDLPDVAHHISRVGYPLEAWVIEQPTVIEGGCINNLKVGFAGYTPPGTAIQGYAYRADTHALLTNLGGNTWKFPPPGVKFYVAWKLTSSDENVAPILLTSYLQKDPIINWNAPGTFTGGNIRSYSVTAPGEDASTEMGSLEVKDPKMEVDALAFRDLVPMELQVQLTDKMGSPIVRLLRGYTRKPKATRVGKAGQVYPKTNWKRHAIPLVGMWYRLQEKVSYKFCADFAKDGNAPDGKGGYFPWKATDAIRSLLQAVGFPPSMIDIPDLEIRLWNPGTDNKEGTYVINPNMKIGRAIQQIAVIYLRGWILFDANDIGSFSDGTETHPTVGKWKLKRPPLANRDGSFTPVFHFVTEAPGPLAGKGRIPSDPRSYPTNTGFLARVVDSPIAPEYNGVIMLGSTLDTTLGAGDQIKTEWFRNCKSYNFLLDPGTGALVKTAHPFNDDGSANPDYRGRCLPLVIGDPTMPDQATATFEGRAFYDYVCHGRNLVEGTGPLYFIQDPVGHYWRPLLYYDVVTIDGDNYFCKGCNPFMPKPNQDMQWGFYEFQKIYSLTNGCVA